jgi:hypothetical protein
MAMCEDYPCCGHTPSDPCGSEGVSPAVLYTAWERRGASDPDFDPFDYYYEEQ